MSLIRQEQPDFVLLDLMMPYVSGLDILDRSPRRRRRSAFIPVVILTAVTDARRASGAVELGATDFLNKPVDASELVPRVRNVLAVKAYQDQLRQLQPRSRSRRPPADRRARESRAAMWSTASPAPPSIATTTPANTCSASAATRGSSPRRSASDPTSSSRRSSTPRSCTTSARSASPTPCCSSRASSPKTNSCHDAEACRLRQAHPHVLLHRRGEAAPQRHAEVGAHILEVGSSQILDMARNIALTHHERWDGTGYPLGLKGEDIPLDGRIIAVADVFDALSSRRSLQEGLPARRVLPDHAGSAAARTSTPTVLDAFLRVRDQVVAVQLRYADED